jgi:predicted permease
MTWWRRKNRNADLERELNSDLDLEEEEQRGRGLSSQEARYAARRAFGNTALIKEQTRAEWKWVSFERLMQDLRYGWRQLAKSPAFTVACVLTLALGIGATTVIYSIMDSFLLRPLPYPNSRRMVRVWNTFPPRGMMEIPVSEPEFNEYRQSRSFEHLAGFSVGAVTLTGSGDALRLDANWGTSEFFSVLGTQPALGRLFTDDEFQKGHDDVAILSYRLWQSHFGANSDIIGKSIILNGHNCTVVAVMPSDFNFPNNAVDVWQPLPISPGSSDLGNHYLNLVADLQPGSTLQSTTAELATIFTRLENKYAAYYSGAVGLGVSLIPLRQQMVGKLRPTVLVLMGAVSFMLLIACTNVASLLLSQGEGRRREIATRMALGATRSHILSQVLVQTLILFLAGETLGLLLAFAGLKWLSGGSYLPLADVGGVMLDMRVLTFATVVTLATGLIFGLIPAIKASRANFSEELKTGGRDTMGGHSHVRARSLLVMSEIAFSLVLLTGAGLMTASLIKLLGVDLGFNPKNVVTMKISLPEGRYPLKRTSAFYEELLNRVRGLPAVQGVAIANQLPMGDVIGNASFEVEGRTSERGDINVADSQIISPDYFRVMGISLMKGRFLTPEDVEPSPASVIVNQSLARKVWVDADPIGKRIRLRSNAPWLSVVGVVSDVKNHGPNVPTRPEMYFLHTDKPFGIWADLRSMTFVVRTASEPEQAVAAIRGQLKQLDPAIPMYKVSTLEQLVGRSFSQTRVPAVTLFVFACTALLLAGVGVYGVLAYVVARSRHDIGVRMALGAQRGQILRFFIGQGVRWAIAGGLAGIVVALWLVQFMHAMLFEISAYDPRILVLVTMVLYIVVFLACIIPSLRAVRVDPMTALRND